MVGLNFRPWNPSSTSPVAPAAAGECVLRVIYGETGDDLPDTAERLGLGLRGEHPDSAPLKFESQRLPLPEARLGSGAA